MSRLPQFFALLLLLLSNGVSAASDEKFNNGPTSQLREELWAIPSTIPMLAYMIRPAGDGPFPLLVMNHGVSLDPKELSYFPAIEFRDAALWFAKRGYVVVAPVRPGYGASAIAIPSAAWLGCSFWAWATSPMPTFEMPASRLRRSIHGCSITCRLNHSLSAMTWWSSANRV